MLSSSQRPVMRVHQTRMLSWLFLLSLALHLVVLTWLLMFPARQPPDSGAEPLSVEIIAEPGSASAAAAPAPAEEAGEPVTRAAPIEQAETPPPPSPLMTTPTPEPVRVPVQQAVVPTPALEVPLALPLEQAEIPLPPLPAVVPDVLAPPPVPQAQAAPPQPPLMSPSRLIEHPRPRPTPPQRPPVRPAPTRALADIGGSTVARNDGGSVAGGANSANNGAAWMGRLKQWWDQHSFYPREASQSDEGGNVKVRIVIAGDGQVTSIQVVQSSGSSVLDAAALAVFRDAHLPPLSLGTPAQPADVVVTLHYRPSRTGG